MKTPIALTVLLMATDLVSAATLRPSMIVYGVVRDSYGLRLGPDSAMVSAFLGTNEVARTPIRTLPAGTNYRFDVNVSDPLTAGPNDVTPGATVAIRVRLGATLAPFIGTNNTFTALGDGSYVNINLILGVDSDGDGLPDDWEWMVIANSGGAVSNLTEVGPGLDLDGDGIPDDEEFFSGTFAFLPGDELRLSTLTPHPSGLFSFTFTSINGASYSVETSATLEPPDWQGLLISLTDPATFWLSNFAGDGQVITVYFLPEGPARFYRLRCL